MRRQSHTSACGAGLALLLCAGLRGGAMEAPGLTWPAEWKVFLPVEREAPIPAADELATIPERMNLDGTAIEGRWVKADDVHTLHGFAVELENVRLDLAPLFGEVVAGNTAWVFLPIESDGARMATFGFGADWWMTAWLNGEELLDTTARGNASWPPLMDDHRVKAALRQGANVLAIRFIGGAGSAVLAVGGPDHLAAIDEMRDRIIPASDRDQAYWSARAVIDLSPPSVDLSRGAIAGIQALPERQMVYIGPDSRGRHRIQDRVNPRFDEPVRLVLSKGRYPAEDRHLDALVWLTPENETESPNGRLEIALRDGAGREIAAGRIEDLSASGLFFSMGFTRSMPGRAAAIEVVWMEGDRVLGRAEKTFEVMPYSTVPRTGRVALTVPNDSGAALANAPFTVGVPFPLGSLYDADTVRLVDEEGVEIRLQARVSSRWSRYGPVKWLLCDFVADLDTGPRTFYLEYGPDVSRAPVESIGVSAVGAGFPSIEAGRLRVSADGVWYDLPGAGDAPAFLQSGALTGAFVKHEDGRLFTVPGDTVHEIEEHGSEKVVVRRTGWYREEGGEGEFCNYVTRLVFHRDSPVVRIYHTWIFTGDGNRDRIREMGWRFPLADGIEKRGFLSSFEGLPQNLWVNMQTKSGEYGDCMR